MKGVGNMVSVISQYLIFGQLFPFESPLSGSNAFDLISNSEIFQINRSIWAATRIVIENSTNE